MKYKIEQVINDDELEKKYIKALSDKSFKVDKLGNIEINTLEEFNQVRKIIDSVNTFDSYLGYNGVILHGNIIIIHDSFIY